jgi:hypothetical protein
MPTARIVPEPTAVIPESDVRRFAALKRALTAPLVCMKELLDHGGAIRRKLPGRANHLTAAATRVLTELDNLNKALMPPQGG